MLKREVNKEGRNKMRRQMVTNMSSDENQKILGYCVRCGRKKTLKVKEYHFLSDIILASQKSMLFQLKTFCHNDLQENSCDHNCIGQGNANQCHREAGKFQGLNTVKAFFTRITVPCGSSTWVELLEEIHQRPRLCRLQHVAPLSPWGLTPF